MLIQSNTPDIAERFDFKYLRYPFSPFKHQREVFEKIYHSNILLESPTSSGKTAAVVYPIIDQVKDTNYRALFIYPTRALLWDQYLTISKVAHKVSLNVAKIDPFTPTTDLYEIFAQNRIITMTPDIFYFTLLRNAQHYKRFYERAIESIRHIVFDEVHLYDTYMLFNLRNLLKVIHEINPEIRIHCLSATLENVKRNFERIIDFETVSGDSYTGEIKIKSIFMPSFQINAEIDFLLAERGKKVVILNSATRAKDIYDILKAKYSKVFLAVGQRFQEEDKRNEHLANFLLSEDAILVASPVVEQGVDFKTDIVLSEDPSSLFSIIQRFGRVGRGGLSGKFIILTKTAKRNNFYNQELILTRAEFERLLEDGKGGSYYTAPLPEEVEMMEAMLWKIWQRTEFKDTFERVNDLQKLRRLYQKYEKYLPDVSFREPNPSVELKSGNLVSIWDCLKRDIWKLLSVSKEKENVTIASLPVKAEEFLKSAFTRYPPSLKLINWETYTKSPSVTLGTGTFEIKGIKFKANGTIQRSFDFNSFRVNMTKGFKKGQDIYFKPKTFFTEED